MKRTKKKSKRPKSKVILFIVEGFTDEKMLNIPLSQLFVEYNKDIIIDFVKQKPKGNNIAGGGDITSAFGVTPENIEHKLCTQIIDEGLISGKKCYYSSEVIQINQIVDLDGAYIPNENIIEDLSKFHPFYAETCILTAYKSKIEDRNKRKRENLNKLISLNSIKVDSHTIPYKIYFFSSNIDHYIHGNANLTQTEKMRKATNFSDNCIFDLKPFLDKICDRTEALNMGYIESWNFIREGNESLHPHTNLNILINSLKNKTYTI